MMTAEHVRYVWQWTVLLCVSILGGILLLPSLAPDFPLSRFFLTLSVVALVNVGVWFLLARGIGKRNREGTVILLAGIGGKFLFYLFYLLVYWIAAKNLTKAFVLTFFALYLIFTFFLAVHLLKLLKNNKLY
ncbi:MAG: hypothetical protein R2751_10945 [Bacteroidales bacterium]